ncbi:caspase family protein [Aureimonas phyllosphaerae]|uniref:Caspase domain-containing protein n=1 Tax=Aureimonas phyllosphaerae TaxID=1166078 RepID=A0A7W6FVM0_9HYPH|nr:caspase family protein [Aureimonas phyllosphaerae]MBB3937338.1 hypothetical protein [Aureimonas phyllosphaerae]MBB3961345.1 hypothetical protein [Aureimonas phyllosphaerae]SFF42116.1 Caspase domain-containing protein [Aureimonas phyllosphaerae]
MSGTHGGRALIVGISRYESVRSLPTAVRADAEDLAALLVDPERGAFEPANVRLLVDEAATTDAMQRELIASSSAPAKDPFLFFFSGHGHRDVTTIGSRSWLLTYESTMSDLDASAFDATDLSDLLGAIPSLRQVVLLDACHAAAVAAGKGDAHAPTGIGGMPHDLNRGAGRALLSSCRAEEVSVVLPGARNSLFTTALLDALRGRAHDRSDGFVRLLDVFHHVAEEVPRHADQHPVLSTENIDGNFPIARRAKSTQVGNAAQRGEREKVLATLYPLGPTQDEIWSRSGGDLSRLNVTGNGLSQWHSALRRIDGGGDLRLITLLRTVADDHPDNDAIKNMIADAMQKLP